MRALPMLLGTTVTQENETDMSQYREVVIVKLLCSVLVHRAAGSHCRFISGLKLIGIPAAN